MTSSGWKIIETHFKTAEEIMAFDRQLLEGFQEEASSILHLYDWPSCKTVTFGHFIKAEEYIDFKKLKELEFQLSKRPTGGGITFHFEDFAYSLILPSSHPKISSNTLNNYRFINQNILKAIQGIFSNPSTHLLESENTSSHPFCMAKPTAFDLIFEGKKMGGSAQRKSKNGLLHQGFIALNQPFNDLVSQVVFDKKHLLLMQESSSFLNQHCLNSSNVRNDLKNVFKKQLIKLISL